MNKIVLVLSRFVDTGHPYFTGKLVQCVVVYSNDLAMFHFQTANNSDGSIFGVHLYAFA